MTTNHDHELLVALTPEPQIVLHIAQQTHRDVMDVERDLYRLADIKPGQHQPTDSAAPVRNYRSQPGIPVKWSTHDDYHTEADGT